jgi:hypothetical protein
MRLFALVLILSACTRGGTADLQLSLSHPRPERLREVLSERFRTAQEKSELTLLSSKVKLDDARLTLDFAVSTDGPCTPAESKRLLEHVRKLATASATLEILSVSPETAEALATELRKSGLEVQTPNDRPGLVTTNFAPDASLLSRFEAQHRMKILRDHTNLWVVDPNPALTSDDMLNITSTVRGVELVVRPEIVTRLAALTELRRPLPIVLDQQFIGAPPLASRASEGRLRLDLGKALSPDLVSRFEAATLSTPPRGASSTGSCRE